MDQGPRPALLVVSSNLMALCFAECFPWARTAYRSSLCVGPLRSEWRFARTFQDYRSRSRMSTGDFVFPLSSFRKQQIYVQPQFCLRPTQRSNVKPSIRRKRRGALGSYESHFCSDLGLKSSWPFGLASWIKRLDCAPSYSSTSSSGRFRPNRPIMPRCEALYYFSYSIATSRRPSSPAGPCCSVRRLTATWLEYQDSAEATRALLRKSCARLEAVLFLPAIS